METPNAIARHFRGQVEMQNPGGTSIGDIVVSGGGDSRIENDHCRDGKGVK